MASQSSQPPQNLHPPSRAGPPPVTIPSNLDPHRSGGLATPTSAEVLQPTPRRTSFNFLRRQKSAEAKQSAMNTRSATGSGKLSKKQRAQAQEELARQQREAAALARSPPRLPTHAPLPTINAFGGAPVAGDFRADNAAMSNNRAGNNYGAYQAHSQNQAPYQQQTHYHAVSGSVPVPPATQGSMSGTKAEPEFNPYGRSESMSMTHRGRYSYASSAVSMGTINSPRRVRRRKDPTPFNILVVGAKNSGKTSFINFLRSSLEKNKRSTQAGDSPNPSAVVLHPDLPFSSQYLEAEIDHERIGVTLWDSQGLEKNVADLQLREMSAFIESKFEETFTEEQKVVRAPGVQDTHIHCVFLILDPIRLDANLAASRNSRSGAPKFSTGPRFVGGLDEDLDLQVLRTLQGKTAVVPVISKADTITSAHMTFLKRTVWNSLKQAKLDPLEALNFGESSDDEEGSDRFDERDEDTYYQSGDDEGQPHAEGGSKKSSKAAGSNVVNNIADPDSSSDYENDRGVGARSSSPVLPSGTSPATSPPSRKHGRNPSTASTSYLAEDELPLLPLSILSPDKYDLDSSPPGRRFAWGFADPYNVDHCDFVRLKDSVFSEWRADLREASREQWYEGWRTSRLNKHDRSHSRPYTVGTAGRTTDPSSRGPNGRPQGMYGSPIPNAGQNGNHMGSVDQRTAGYGAPGMAM